MIDPPAPAFIGAAWLADNTLIYSSGSLLQRVSAAGVTPGGNYTISFAAVTPTTYTLQAVATGSQTKDTAACLTFTINEQGARTPADTSGCWR